MVVRYLAADPAFEGIGVARAHALWEAFGTDLYRILGDGDVGALATILGEERAEATAKAWRERLAEADVVAWLDEHGFDPRLAAKAIRFWGAGAAGRLRENPYVLMALAPWPVVDAAARRLGFGTGHEHRLVAAVEAVLYRRLESGHTWTARDAAAAQVAQLLPAGPAAATRAVRLAEGLGAAAPCGDGIQPLGAHVMERFVADRVASLLAPRSADLLHGGGAIAERAEGLLHELGAGLTPEQAAAVRRILPHPLALLTGGAGTGKTTTLRVLCEVAARLGIETLGMALAGRAAARMREATGRPARTIASFLAAAARGEVTTGPGTLLVVDEASMLDLPLLYRLLRAVGEGCRLLLTGDPHQLPPIGFGLTFHLLAATAGVPNAALAQVHRQAAASGIPAVAADIRAGVIPDLVAWRRGVTTGISMLACPAGGIGDAVVDVAADLEAAGDEVQILSPVRAGEGGVAAINDLLHGLRSVGRERVPGRALAVGDPLLWTKNDYGRELWNGSLGRLLAVERNGGARVEFDGRTHVLGARDLDEVAPAYCLTVHKAQGSGFARAIVVVPPGARLDRAMLYTAVTRGVRQVVVVGDPAAVARAVRDPPRSQDRETGLGRMLAA